MSTFISCEKLREIERELSISIIPSRINGKRWGFVPDCGKTVFNLPVGASHKIKIDADKGYIVYGWDELGGEQREILQRELRGKSDE